MSKFIKPSVNLVSTYDERVSAWNESRKNLVPVTSVEMVDNVDLTLNEFKMYTFQVVSSVLLRELFTSIRPIHVWASTSRNTPFDSVGIMEEYMDGPYHAKSLSLLQSVRSSTDHQDLARMSLPISHGTSYSIMINHRTLISFLKSIHKINYELFKVYGVLFLNALMIDEKKLLSYKYGTLEDSVMIDKDEKVMEDSTTKVGSMMIVKTHLKFSLLAQLVRHTQIKVKTNIWNLVANKHYANIELSLDSLVLAVLYMPVASYQKMISHRSCFVGSTKVKLLDGRIRTMEELAISDEVVEVMTYSSDGSPVPSKAISSGIQKFVTELYQVELDDGTVEECTGDHLWMMKDGTYKRADELNNNDSLMSAYYKMGHDKSVNNIKRTRRVVLPSPVPVYDLSIQHDNHNFALASGPVVHNCIIADPSLWSEFLEVATQGMTTYQKKVLLPCKCNNQLCPFEKDMQGRIEGHDPGPICPIYTNDKSRIGNIIKIYGSTPTGVKNLVEVVEEYL